MALSTAARRPRRVSDSTVNTATSTPGAGATRFGLFPAAPLSRVDSLDRKPPPPLALARWVSEPGPAVRPRGDTRRRPEGISPWQAGHRGGGCKVIVPTAPRWRPRAWAVVSTQMAPARETDTSTPRHLKD